MLTGNKTKTYGELHAIKTRFDADILNMGAIVFTFIAPVSNEYYYKFLFYVREVMELDFYPEHLILSKGVALNKLMKTWEYRSGEMELDIYVLFNDQFQIMIHQEKLDDYLKREERQKRG